MLGAVALSASCGAVNGVLITTLRVVPFIVTLGTMLVVRGAAKGLADERRIEAPMTWLNDLLRTAGDGRGWLVPRGVWMTAILAVLVAVTLNYTRFGRHLFAIGSNERTARLCGVRVDACKIAVYTLARRAGRPCRRARVLADFGRRSDGRRRLRARRHRGRIIGGGSLAGGKGSITGTLAGAAIMTVIHVGCSQQGLPNWVQQIVTGGIIVAAVVLDRWRER